MKKLMERSDAMGLLQCMSILGLSAATGTLAYWSFLHWPWWATALLVYLHGTVFFFHGAHAAVHELSHGTPFKSKGLNAFFYALFGFISWTSTVKYRQSHIRHHMVTVHTDRDLEVVLPWLAGRLQWLGHWTVDWHLMASNLGTLLRHSVGILKGEWEHRLFPPEEKKLRRRLFNWARFVLIGQAALAAVFILSGHWFLLLLFTVAPFIGGGLAWLVTYPQHAGLPPDVPDFRICCRSVRVNPLVRYLHWQMDYHVEHHMFAGVPFYNLKRLRKLIEYDLPEYEPLLPTWKKMRPVLRRQRSDPDYCEAPILPGTP
jgi:fatty acid desaturase